MGFHMHALKFSVRKPLFSNFLNTIMNFSSCTKVRVVSEFVTYSKYSDYITKAMNSVKL